jgi:hypothetical protein
MPEGVSFSDTLLLGGLAISLVAVAFFGFWSELRRLKEHFRRSGRYV